MVTIQQTLSGMSVILRFIWLPGPCNTRLSDIEYAVISTTHEDASEIACCGKIG